MKYSYLRVSLTKDCNANCKFCHNEGQNQGLKGNNTTQQRSLLSEEQYEYISKFFRKSFSKVLFTGGEPTTVSNLPEIIKIFKKDGYSTKITTNGFALTPSLQLKLKNVGLDEINISIPSLDEKEHSEAFGIENMLPIVLKNLSFLPYTFPDKVKINFMAIEGKNVPNQLIEMSNISAKYNIPISFLTLVSDNNKNLLSNKVFNHLKEALGEPELKKIKGKFGDKKFYTFNNGCVWEFDDFREESYKKEALNNDYCNNCNKNDKCTEGPYALRILHNSKIKPCLIRQDNTLDLLPQGYIFYSTKER